MIWQRKLIGAALSAVAVGTAMATVPAGPASASTACSGTLITINNFPGGEGPSQRWGHYHASGNHYIRSTVHVGTGRVLVWWADNSKGLDGDNADTHYADRYCP